MRATQNLSRPARWSPGDPHLSLVLPPAPILVDPELTDVDFRLSPAPYLLVAGGRGWVVMLAVRLVVEEGLRQRVVLPGISGSTSSLGATGKVGGGFSNRGLGLWWAPASVRVPWQSALGARSSLSALHCGRRAGVC